MTHPPLPEILWKAFEPKAEFSPSLANDEYGNTWHRSADQERIILKARDGRHFEGFTERECWDQYLAAGFEVDYQSLLVDALYFAWSQAEAQGLTGRADQFRKVYDLARDGKVSVGR